jgi:hypothetical protein
MMTMMLQLRCLDKENSEWKIQNNFQLFLKELKTTVPEGVENNPMAPTKAEEGSNSSTSSPSVETCPSSTDSS